MTVVYGASAATERQDKIKRQFSESARRNMARGQTERWRKSREKKEQV